MIVLLPPQAGDARDLPGCAGRDEAKIARVDDRVASRGDKRAPPPGPLAAERPAVTGKRRDPDERGDRRGRQPPERREIAEERAAHDGAEPGTVRSATAG